jgi:predicted RNA-binding protein with PUA-like domain
MPQHWLVKSEPSAYSIADLQRDGRTYWDGVRNYQARNYLRQMQPGDRVLFYHSNADPPGVAGTARVVAPAYPDFTAWDPSNPHYDPKSTPEHPIWDMVDLEFEAAFEQPVPLDVLRTTPELQGLELLRRGSRLSVMPVTAAQFATIVKLGRGRQATRSPAQRRGSAHGSTGKSPTRAARGGATHRHSAAGRTSSASRRRKPSNSP